MRCRARPQTVPPVPEQTARIARLAFPKGNLYLQIRDEIGVLLTDADFVDLFPSRGQPAYAPWRLALITIFQFIENLSDRAAAESVRARIDWKYALSLELENSGFDSTVLCEFRARLVAENAENLLFEKLLDWCREQKMLKTRGRQRTDSTHVLAAVRGINRLECVLEAMRNALNAIAKESPEWLPQLFQTTWLERYSPRAINVRIPHSAAGRQEFAETVGCDAYALLDAVYNWSELLASKEIEAVETLRRVVIQQFYVDERGVHWRTSAEGIPPSLIFINSPYDLDAHYGKKRQFQWTGYKVYLTETCDEEMPRLITNVETSSAPVADFDLTEPIHQSLEKKNLLPAIHLVDMGFVDAELMIAAQKLYDVDLYGPSHADQQWQSRNDPKFSGENFSIDWERKQAVCPMGKTSSSWSDAATETGKRMVKIKFLTKDCRVCPVHHKCTKSKQIRRTLSILPQEQYELRQVARAREQTSEYKLEYRRRSGIEGTMRTGGERVWNAPFALCRRGKNASAKRADGDGGQCRTTQQLVKRSADSKNKTAIICQSNQTSETDITNSPAVSKMRKTHFFLLSVLFHVRLLKLTLT